MRAGRICRGGWSRSSRRGEIFAKVESFLVYDPLGHRLAAFIVKGFVIEVAVEAGVQRPVAFRTWVAKADAITNFNRFAAFPTGHHHPRALLRPSGP